MGLAYLLIGDVVHLQIQKKQLSSECFILGYPSPSQVPQYATMPCSSNAFICFYVGPNIK